MVSGLVSSDEQNEPRNIGAYVVGETSLGEVPNTVLLSLSSSEKEEGLLQSKMVGTIIPGWVGESPCMENMAELSREWDGG